MGFYPFAPVVSAGVALPDNVNSVSGVVPTFNSCSRVPTQGGSVASQTSGVISLAAIYVPPGQPLRQLGFSTGSTAAVTPANWWMVLCTLAGVVLGVTPDQLTRAIGTFSVFQLLMGATVVTPGQGPELTQLLVGLMVNAATVPTLEGGGQGGLGNSAPVVSVQAGTALTGPPAVGSNVGAFSVGLATPNLWAN